MQTAADLHRLIVTRDVVDFSRLAGLYLRHQRPFPGILFIPPSIPERDPGALIDAIIRWTARYGVSDRIEGGIAWLSPDRSPEDDRRVHEPRSGYQRALERIGATI